MSTIQARQKKSTAIAATVLMLTNSWPLFAQRTVSNAAVESPSVAAPVASPISVQGLSGLPTLPSSYYKASDGPSAASVLSAQAPAALSAPGRAGLAAAAAPVSGLAGVSAAKASMIGAAAPAVQGRELSGLRELGALNASEPGDSKVEARIRSRYDGAAPAEPVAEAPASLIGSLYNKLATKVSSYFRTPSMELAKGHVGLYEVPVAKLRYVPEPSILLGTRDLPADLPGKIVGQDRAVESLNDVLRMEGPGYNVIVTGPKGSGRLTAVKQLLGTIRKEGSTRGGGDVVSVRDFSDIEQVKLLSLPAGSAERFQQAMAAFLGALKQELRTGMSAIDQKAAALEQALLQDRDARIEELKKKVDATPIQGFPKFTPILIALHEGRAHAFAPGYEGRPLGNELVEELVKQGVLSMDKMPALMAAFKKTVEQSGFKTELASIYGDLNGGAAKVNEEMGKQRQAVIGATFDALSAPIQAAFPSEDIGAYLQAARAFTLEKYPGLINDGGDEAQENPLAAMMGGGGAKMKSIPISAFYQVDVAHTHSSDGGRPVVVEKDPTYDNAIGFIEEKQDGKGGTVKYVKTGSVKDADGGFWVADGWKVVQTPGLYYALKKVMQNGELEISEDHGGTRLMLGRASRKERIKVNAKVVLIGDSYLQMILGHYDPDFKDMFRGKAQFDRTMERTPENARDYMELIARLVRSGPQRLRDLTKSAMGKLLEFACWLGGDQGKLGTSFGEIDSLASESDLYAKLDPAGDGLVHGRHVSKAIEQRVRREELGNLKMLEYVEKDWFKIDVKGSEVGDINALAVTGHAETAAAMEDQVRQALGIDAARPRYFTPERVAAMARELGPVRADGTHGVVMRMTATHQPSEHFSITSTDKSADMLGPIATKANVNIAGFFKGRYGKKGKLKADITVSHEQSYGGIEGDSASLAQTLTIISDLAGLKNRKDLSITGSMSTKGDAQIIGGENYKIEGFFDICKRKGFTGTQGVVIPETNMNGLHLREDIVEAIKEGKFHIYAVRNIDEAIEIFTGVKAGERDAKGNYPKGSVNEKVESALLGSSAEGQGE